MKESSMKPLMIVIVALIAVLRGMAYTEAELKLWYGNDNDRAPLDDLMEEVSSKPMSMSMQEYRALQATNQTPVLADVIASNIAHAVQMGQSTNGVTWTTDDELRMRIPPPPDPSEDWMHQSSRHLMMLMGVQAGDMSAVCTNWFMPTNICLNGTSYDISRPEPDQFEIYMTTNAQQEVAHGRCYEFNNGKDARIEGFLLYLCQVKKGPIGTAFGLSVNNLDPATNMLYLSSKEGISPACNVLICKNLVLHMCAPTNAVEFAVAILNAGLPENERIVVSTEE